MLASPSARAGSETDLHIGRWRLDGRVCLALALLAWTLPLVLVAIRVALGRSDFESYVVYDTAGHAWHEREPLYDDTLDGFQYLPQSALLFATLTPLGLHAGGIVWRALSWILLAHALLRACRLGWPRRWPAAFVVATALTLGPSLSSLVTGQANLITAALMLEATLALAEERLWPAALWMAVGLALKPLMVVPLLLAIVLRPRLLPRALLLLLIVLAAVPLTLAPSSYVVEQTRAFFAKAAHSAQPDRYFEDLRGLGFRLGWIVPHPLLSALRVGAAGAAAALAWLLRRRQRQPDASVYVFALAAVYLMLFNPRTQPNSYVIAAPAVALAGARAALRQRWPAALGLGVIAASWCGMNPLTNYWLRPLTCIVFAVLLVRELVTPRSTTPPP